MYSDFLQKKNIVAQNSGFDIDKSELNDNLFEYQKDVVKWALKKGKAALFEDCGLGKTLQQLEWANQICKHENGNVLILAPLAVAKQTQREGEKFGIEVNIADDQTEIIPGINITNYEKLEHFNINEFIGVVLDESSILKSFTSKTRTMLINKFKNIPYRLACTATPAPNDYMELGNHSEFLGVMTRAEMLAMYFVHDGGQTSKWRLKGHAESIFWQWMGSWCVFISNPKDLDYEVDGYNLPKLNLNEIIVDGLKPSEESLSLTERRNARKESLEDRCKAAAELVNDSEEQWLVWCDLNNESKRLSELINDSIEVKGSDKPQCKSDSMLGFSNKKIKCLITKPSIAGFGMNWQNCHNMIFVGLSDSYEQYYQAVRRCYRFGQENEVNVYIIISSKEGCVKANIERKQIDADKMAESMRLLTKDITKNEIKSTTRIYTPYDAHINMLLPRWEEFEC